MKQLVFRSGHGLKWHEIDAPQLMDDTDAIVRPIAVAVCDADRAIVAGFLELESPHHFGHEFVAEVVEVGSAVSNTKIGDRVVVSFKISCGTCDRCVAGHTAACTTVPLKSAFGFGVEMSGAWGGAMTDLVRVPFANHMLVQLPPNVSPTDAASAGDNLVDAYRCVAPGLEQRPGSPVLIVAAGGGAPSISLYAAGIAVALGAERVDYVDRDPERLEIAEHLGANPVKIKHPDQVTGQYAVTADTSGHPSGRWLDATVRATAPYGLCTSCGSYQQGLEMPLGVMYEKGIEFTIGWVNARPLMPAVLQLLSEGRIDTSIIHTVVDWDEAPTAIPGLHTKLVLSRS